MYMINGFKVSQNYIDSKIRILEYLREDFETFKYLLTYTESVILKQMFKVVDEIEQYMYKNPSVWRQVLKVYHKDQEEEILTPFDVDCNYSAKAYFRNWKTFEKIQKEKKAFSYW